MSSYVIRLPGGGRIKRSDSTQALSWWEYRNHYISTRTYTQLTNFIQNNKNQKLVFVSGGVGAFLYTDLCKSLGLNSNFESEIGIEIISIMHKVLIEHLSSSGVSVYKSEVPIEDLETTMSHSEQQCFFIKCDSSFQSTDSIAAHAAAVTNSRAILFLKQGAPNYHAGFEKETKVTKWDISDIHRKAKNLWASKRENYILDVECSLKIKNDGIKSSIMPPELLERIILDAVNYGLESSDCYTEIVI